VGIRKQQWCLSFTWIAVSVQHLLTQVCLCCGFLHYGSHIIMSLYVTPTSSSQPPLAQGPYNKHFSIYPCIVLSIPFMWSPVCPVLSWLRAYEFLPCWPVTASLHERCSCVMYQMMCPLIHVGFVLLAHCSEPSGKATPTLSNEYPCNPETVAGWVGQSNDNMLLVLQSVLVAVQCYWHQWW